jgi:hypothetical protein
MVRAKTDPQVAREITELAELLRREMPSTVGISHRTLARRLHTAGVRIFPVLRLARSQRTEVA